ncbi:MAG TPA: hypothetical protein ENI11_06070 [Actinobacteria bacterium]|nr:hypothetical protein [Actinomycetota bacterium]
MPVLLQMNNYFNDFATALLVTSALVIKFLARSAERHGHVEAVSYFVDIYPKLAILGRLSVWGMIITGMVRLFSFQEFEWAEAVGRGQEGLLVFKYFLLFAAFVVGGYFWWQLLRKVRQLKELVSRGGISSPISPERNHS